MFSRNELIFLQRQYAHYRGLPLHEVAVRRLETFEFVLGRAPTAEERAQAVEASGAFVFRGVVYRSLPRACRHLGVSYGAVKRRAKRLGGDKCAALESALVDGVQTREEFEFRGVVYVSFAEACRAHGINPSSVGHRITQKGGDKRAALESVLTDGVQTREEFVFRDVVYVSLKEACRQLGVSYSAVQGRASLRGINKHAALEAVLADGSKEFVFRDVAYASLKAACRQLGVSYNVVQGRALRNGGDKHAALETVLAEGSKEFVFRGDIYVSLAAACRQLGVKYGAVLSRAKQNGGDRPAALEAVIADGNKEFEFRDVVYASLKAACRQLGVSYPAVLSRAKKNGGDKPTALESVLTDGVRPREEFEFRGVVYVSLAEACRRLGVDHNTILHRAKKNGGDKHAAIEAKLMGGKPRRGFVFRGVAYSSLTEACRQLGVSFNIVLHRATQNGWGKCAALESVLTDGVKPREEFVFRGVVYKNLKAACRQLGASYNAVNGRIKTNGGDKHAAMESVLTNGIREVEEFEFRGVIYPHFAAACKALGVSYNAAQLRRKRKTYGDKCAALESVLTDGVRHTGKFVFKGVVYAHLKAACEQLGVNYNVVLIRSKKNGGDRHAALEALITIEEKGQPN